MSGAAEGERQAARQASRGLWAVLIIAVVVSGLAILLSVDGLFEGIDNPIHDRRVRAVDLERFRQGRGVSASVVILDVPLQERSVWRSGEPGARRRLAAAIRALHRGGATAIVLNTPLDTPSEDDAEVASACREAGNVVLRSQIESPRPTQFGVTLPLRVLREAAASYGYSYWTADEDGTVRRFAAALGSGYELSLALATWAVVRHVPQDQLLRSLRLRHALPDGTDLGDDLRVHLEFQGPPREGFEVLSFSRLDERLAAVTGKVVVLGSLDLSLGGLSTPLSTSWRPAWIDRWPEPMSAIELSANAIQTLLDDHLLHPVAPEIHWLLLLALGVVAGVAAGRLRNRYGLPLCLLLGVGWSWLSGWLYRDGRYDLPQAAAWVTLVVCAGIGVYRKMHADIVHHRQELADADAERRRLGELDQAKRAVMGTVVHDLKVPVAIIKGQALTLASDPDRELGLDLHQEFLNTIASQCDRLNSMIEDILDTDPARHLSLVAEPTDLAALVRHVLEMHEATAAYHTFRLEADPVPPIPLDALKITRVLNNLVSNAVKYSPAGGEVLVRIERRGPEVAVAVRDRGIGMTPAQVQRLFGLFVRVLDDPAQIPGTGVGLYSARRLVEAHGGRIEVSSTPGEGSEFRIILPTGLNGSA